MSWLDAVSSIRVQRVLVIAIGLVSLLNLIAFDTHKITSANSFDSTGTTKLSLDRSITVTTTNTTTKQIIGNKHGNVTTTHTKTKKLEFCGHCNFNPRNSCNERLQYLMDRYKTPEDEAKESLISQCGIDYDSEPYVLLHSGPHKTGTTSIQSFLYTSLFKNATYLQQDKFAIPTFDDLPGIFGGDGPMLNFAHCMLKDFAKDGGQMNVGMCNKLRGDKSPFPKFLKKHYNQSHHVLLVAEDLDRLTIDHGRIQYYLQPYRRFKVVVTYRRMHDWLPSWYNQIVELYLGNYIANKTRYPSFVEWIDYDYDHFRRVHAMEVARRYRESNKFESVDIVNMHDGVGFLEDLFCNYLPFADATCQSIKDGDKPKKKNVGKTYEYERLATKAQLYGKISNKDAPKVAARLKLEVVKRGIFKDTDDYPTICLNQTFLDKLLQTEMDQEQQYFPQWYESQGGDAGLRIAFDKAKPKLCSMDEEKILASGILDSIFEELNR